MSESMIYRVMICLILQRLANSEGRSTKAEGFYALTLKNVGLNRSSYEEGRLVSCAKAHATRMRFASRNKYFFKLGLRPTTRI